MPSRNGVQTDSNGIEVSGLVREFKGGVRAVDGIEGQWKAYFEPGIA